MAITEGKKAPAFKLGSSDGEQVSLKDLEGTTTVLYFYPKDDTPGCTKEACGFRDLWGDVKKLGVRVYGVSPDDGASHDRFIAKYKLPFPLLSDPDRKMMEKYEAYGEKMMYGRKTTGVIRSTVIIGPDGRVLKHWRKVPKAADHPARVLEVLKELGVQRLDPGTTSFEDPRQVKILDKEKQSLLEQMNQRGKDRLPELFGFTVTDVYPGGLDAEIEIRPEFLAPNGYLHAATIIALADTSCGYGCIANLPDEASNFTTVELKSNFLGTETSGRILCEANAAHLGRTTQVWDAVVSSGKTGRRIAIFRCTQMILR